MLMTCSAQTEKPVAVVFDGPYPTQDRFGDEVATWSVSLVDDDDADLKTYTQRSYEGGLALAQRIAKDRKIELVIDADRA